MRKVMVIGAGGHSRVIIDILEKNKIKILGLLDDDKIGKVGKYNILGKVSDCLKYKDKARFIIAIGNNYTRQNIYNRYQNLDYIKAIHPTAVIANDVRIDSGTVVMANTVVNTGVSVGKHSILNTCAVVEHDCIIGDFCHISPNVSIGGTCIIGSLSHIGIGATVINNLEIGENCVVGAGGVVVKNIEKQGTYMGVPVRIKA